MDFSLKHLAAATLMVASLSAVTAPAFANITPQQSATILKTFNDASIKDFRTFLGSLATSELGKTADLRIVLARLAKAAAAAIAAALARTATAILRGIGEMAAVLPVVAALLMRLTVSPASPMTGTTGSSRRRMPRNIAM